MLSAPVHITFSSLSYNVEGVFNSVVAGKFVRYFQPSWRSTRFVARKSKSLFLLLLRKHFCAGATCFQKGFLFNKWAISRALIGGCSIRLQTMEITWWWHNWFFSFSRARFSEKLQREWTSKTGNVIVRNKSTTIFYGLYSCLQYKWRQNVQNFAMKPRLLVPLEFWTLWRHFYGR